MVLLDENADFVIRRRIPRILSEIDTADADQALVDALSAGRFEVRYRAAVALARRRKGELTTATGDWHRAVWEAIEREVGRDRPIWELQKNPRRMLRPAKTISSANASTCEAS